MTGTHAEMVAAQRLKIREVLEAEERPTARRPDVGWLSTSQLADRTPWALLTVRHLLITMPGLQTRRGAQRWWRLAP